MSKTRSKSKKNKSTTSKSKVKPENEVEVPVHEDAEEEFTAGEKLLLASKPYWAHILLGLLCFILATVLWSTWNNMSQDSASQPWRDLQNAVTQASLTSDVSALKEMASNYQGTAASHWALLMAGDNEINRGVRLLATDRIGGAKLIETGIGTVETVVNAPASSKTPMLQRRSTFMLAQGNEAIGKFEVAKKHYQALLDEAPDCPFADPCSRGVSRCSNKDLAAVYTNFRDWKEATEVAPGPLVPDAPQLNIDEIQLPEGEPNTFDVGGGDFGGDMKKDEPAEKPEMVEKTPEAPEKPEMTTEKTEPEAMPEVKKVVEPAMDTPAVEPEGVKVETEMPATEVPAVETPATEVPATEVPATEVPATEIPVTEVPATEVPATEIPATEIPATEIPATEIPATEVPATEVPAVEPVTEPVPVEAGE